VMDLLASLFLILGNKKKSVGTRLGEKGMVANHLDELMGHQLLDRLGRMRGSDVPLKKPLSCAHIRCHVLQNLSKGVQGLDDLVGIGCLATEDIVGVHHPLVAKGGQDHLHAQPSLDLGLNRAWCSLLMPLLWKVFALRGVL
jgi:hypothetical protein